jgi:hypothetical protein
MEPLMTSEVSELARYNADRSRGLVFDAAATERMREMQARFDGPGWFAEDGTRHTRLLG